MSEVVTTPPFDAGRVLLPLARAAIASRLGLPAAPVDDTALWLRRPGCCFVTLKLDGRLRGCIGSLEPHRPLGQDVQANAAAAALRDSRFQPLTADEYPHLRVEVSVLSPTEPITFTSEANALAQLRPHVDGVILEQGRHRGTYLPQVWEQLPDPADFLRSLKQKAGLRPDAWGDDVRLFRYTVTAWEEPA